MFSTRMFRLFAARCLPVLLAMVVLLGGCAAELDAPGEVTSAPVESAPSQPSAPGVPSADPSADESTVTPEDPVRYVLCTKDELHRGDLLLVNGTAPYDASLCAGEITDVRSGRVTNIQEGTYALPIEKSLLQTMEAMQTGMQQAMGDGVCLLINDSYRSAEAQQATIDEYLALYGQAYVDKYVAPVGYSEHHTGLAVDMSFYNPSNGAVMATTSAEAAAHYAWILENCRKYGLILRYPPGKEAVAGTAETWHFRYVGIPHAGYIASNDLVLEEYLDILKKTSFEQPLSITTDGEAYSVYYVPATGDETLVPVPADKPYTLSGDNANGFIVTVKKNG